MRRRKKVQIKSCEICGCKDLSTLQKHHIVERTELNTNNYDFNLAVICGNCHLLVHSGVIKLIGIYPCTNENRRILIYSKDGVKNVEGIDEPYYIPEAPRRKLWNKT